MVLSRLLWNDAKSYCEENGANLVTTGVRENATIRQ